MQQVSLVQVLTGFKRYFRSIDVRTVVMFEEPTLPLPILTGIRISSKPVGTIKEHHAELVRRFGPRTTKRLKVLWAVAPYGRFQKIYSDLLSGKISIHRKQIPLSNSIEFDKLSSSIARRQQFEVESSSGGTWPSVFFSGSRSAAYDRIVRVYNRPDITTELIRETRCRSVEEFVGAFLEVVRPNAYDRDFFVHIEMPARIKRAEIGKGRVRVEVEGERSIRDLKLSIQVRTSSDRPAVESRELIPEKVDENHGLAVLVAEGQLEARSGQGFVSIVLSHRSGLEIDEQHIDLSKMRGVEEPEQPSLSINPFEVLMEGESRVSEEDEVSQERLKQMGGGADPKKVFVVHGRNEAARRSMFSFLRSLHLEPIEWTHALELTGEGSPYIGQVLDAVFEKAQAVVVLFSGDEVARLRDKFVGPADPPHERKPYPQPRANVLFEAGMAFGRAPERTILVELGTVRPFSDVAGRHVVRLTGDLQSRQDLALRLKRAGCTVNMSGIDWHTEGDFSSAVSEIPLPPDLAIIPPSPDVPAELAQFSGHWEGIWDSLLAHELVIEKISPPTAQVVYAYGDCKAWSITRSFARRTGTFEDDRCLHLRFSRDRGPVHVIYRPAPDFTELLGSYEYGGQIARAVMKRVPSV